MLLCAAVGIINEQHQRGKVMSKQMYTVRLYTILNIIVEASHLFLNCVKLTSLHLNFMPPLALLKLLDVVIPCFLETVRTEQERQVVMAVLETMNSVIKSCKEEVFKNPSRLKEISHVIRDVLKKKVRRWKWLHKLRSLMLF